jgi:hypothetical protein
MESKPDILTMAIAICIAAYAAVAIRYVAYHDLGFSLQEIRDAAMAIAVVIAALVAMNCFREELGGTE